MGGGIEHLNVREVLHGVEESVGMIEAKPIHITVRQELSDQLMRLTKDAGFSMRSPTRSLMSKNRR